MALFNWKKKKQETSSSPMQQVYKQQANNEMRIIKESLSIIQKTKNADTFYSRLDTAEEAMKRLIQIEPHVKLTGATATQLLESFYNDKPKIIEDFRQRTSPAGSLSPSINIQQQGAIKTTPQNEINFSDWYISVSFGKSTSSNYAKAVALAKSAPQYHEQIDDGNILHQAVYSASPTEYLAFIMLYELVGSWKSSFVMINGQLIDRKIIGQINYCYGDFCRSGNRRFCYGASWATENPFGCHRIQISAYNHPWWSFAVQQGRKYVLNKQAILERIHDTARIYSLCPAFDMDTILRNLDDLPNTLSKQDLERFINKTSSSFTITIKPQ